MNGPYQIPGIVLETMKMVPVQQWDLMFESLITEKALSISGCAKGKDLKKLQAKIEQLMELREFFKSEMTRK